MVNSDLTQTQSVGGTDTPQSAATNIGASDASPFQQSASADALKQNKTIQVTPNGNPLTEQSANSGTSASAIIFIVVSSIVLVMIASSVFKWVMKRPEPSKPDKPVDKPTEISKENIVISSESTKAKNNKKVPRSKRNKSKK